MYIEKYLRLRSQDVALFKFVIEGYEGLATVTTIERRAAVIRISVPGESSRQVDEIIAAIIREFCLDGLVSLDSGTLN